MLQEKQPDNSGRLRKGFVPTFLTILLLGLCLGSAHGAPLEKVRLQLKWFNQFQFAGYYAAQAKGFYRAEGLEIETLEGSQDNPPDKAVLDGKAEFGVHDGGDLVYQRLRGNPVVVVASVFQHSPYVIISRNFRHPSDLVGQTIPITQDQGSAQILAMLRREGVKVQSVFDKTPVQFVQHPWSLEPFVRGQVKAIAAYSTELPRFRRIYGFTPAVIDPLDYGVDFYGDTLFTREELVNERPVLVERFRRATLRGWEYAMAHQEEMASLIEVMPSKRAQKPSHQDLLDEAKALEAIILPRLVAIGNMNPGRWENMAQVYRELSMVPADSQLGDFVYSVGNDAQRIHRYVGVLAAVLAIVTTLALLSLGWIRVLRSHVRARTDELAADVARRQAAEEQMQAAKQLLDTIVDSVPHMIFLKRGDDLRFELLNKAGEQLLGLQRESLIGKNDYDLFPREQAEFFTRKDRETLDQFGTVDIPEETITTALGERILHTRKVPLHDAKGNPTHLLGISEDITEAKKSENLLRESEAKLRGLFELSRVGIALTDMAGRYVEFNPAFEEICGYSRDELNRLDYWELTPKEYAAQEAAQLESLTTHGYYGPYEKEYIRKDGTRIPLKLNGALIRGADGKQYIWSIVENISERKRSEARLQLTSRVFESTLEGILITDQDLKIVEVNDAFTRITGYSREDIVGHTPTLLKSGRHESGFYERMWRAINHSGHWAGEIWNKKKDGEIFPEMLTISAVKDDAGEVMAYVGVFSDITQIKQHEKQLERTAHYDALTGIPNRVLLADRMKQALAHAKRNQSLLAVCYLDLDGFKPINDAFGHAVGDKILIEIGKRLQEAIRADDTVARLGGDEFVILLAGVANQENLGLSLERLLETIARTIEVDGQIFSLTASIGVTQYSGGDEDSDALLRQADQAMYIAKRLGKSRYHLYDPERDQRFRAKKIIQEQVALGLKGEEFELYYQPKINLRTRSLVGAEALIRWRHPQRGMLSPIEFLPMIENTELDVRLGEWVIESALRQIGQWQQSGLDLEVSINISAFHLQSRDFAGQLAHALSRHGPVGEKRLQIEILETAALEDMQKVTEIIETCRAFGVSFALDDFGTGYSSLAYLSNLPINTLKIDQSFIRHMMNGQSDRMIVQGVIALAKAFALEIVAEGVESGEIFQLLVDMGCEIGQGYGIARPMPALALSQWRFE